jgi:acetyl esterase/lipase
MSLVFQCRCGFRATAGKELAGKIVRCQQCGCKLRIPALPDPFPGPEPDGDPTGDEPSRGLFGTRIFRGKDGERQARRVCQVILVVVILIWLLNGGVRRTFRSLVPALGVPDRSEYRNLSLTQARQGFQTRLVRRESANEPVEPPPPGLFQVVRFRSNVGDLDAYVTPDPNDGRKHPAIVWITGGDCNTIGNVWHAADPRNDQTARAFREAEIIMMFPTLRGGNVNPGVREGFFGEVDDVLAATEFLARQNYVDPGRIYLGGHSTGGTLVLLVAAASNRFRAVFSFGPVDEVSSYPPEFVPFDTSNPKEIALRSPAYWLHSVQSPTFVFEGASGTGNIGALRAMSRASTNPMLHFHPVAGTDHFSVLAPMTRIIAGKILQDSGPVPIIVFSENELHHPSGP